jgi:hypothetical protein
MLLNFLKKSFIKKILNFLKKSFIKKILKSIFFANTYAF